jgi:hypothetical protein
MLDVSKLAAHRLETGIETVVYDDDLRPAVPKDEFQLASRESIVQGDRNEAVLETRQIENDQLGPVRQQEGHAISALQSARDKAG